MFTVEEIKQLLQAASRRKRLYLLLMLNCGTDPVDIASLRQEEIRLAEECGVDRQTVYRIRDQVQSEPQRHPAI